MASDDPELGVVQFDELETVDPYEATFTGTLDGREPTLTYVLESAVGADESPSVYSPGDEALEPLAIQPDSYDFEAESRGVRSGRGRRGEPAGPDGRRVLLIREVGRAASSGPARDLSRTSRYGGTRGRQ